MPINLNEVSGKVQVKLRKAFTLPASRLNFKVYLFSLGLARIIIII